MTCNTGVRVEGLCRGHVIKLVPVVYNGSMNINAKQWHNNREVLKWRGLSCLCTDMTRNWYYIIVLIGHCLVNLALKAKSKMSLILSYAYGKFHFHKHMHINLSYIAIRLHNIVLTIMNKDIYGQTGDTKS